MGRAAHEKGKKRSEMETSCLQGKQKIFKLSGGKTLRGEFKLAEGGEHGLITTMVTYTLK